MDAYFVCALICLTMSFLTGLRMYREDRLNLKFQRTEFPTKLTGAWVSWQLIVALWPGVNMAAVPALALYHLIRALQGRSDWVLSPSYRALVEQSKASRVRKAPKFTGVS